MVVQNIHAFHSMAHSDGKNQSKAPWKDLISSNTAQMNYITIKKSQFYPYKYPSFFALLNQPFF